MRLKRQAKIRLGQAAIILGLVVALELLVGTGMISRLVLSKPSVIAERLITDLVTAEFWEALATSVIEVVLALFFSLLIGTGVGYVLYRFRMFRQAVEPMLVAFYSAPAVLLYPVFLTLFGQGTMTVVTMAVVLGSVPIAINIAVGLGSIAPIWRKVGRSLNATSRQMLFQIMVPAATPIIVTGFRLGLTFALVGVIALEFLTYSGGLGKLVSWRYFVFDTEGVFAAIVLVMTIAVIINALLNLLEGRVRSRWG
jgi:NitT/TauT family transport system permease protein